MTVLSRSSLAWFLGMVMLSSAISAHHLDKDGKPKWTVANPNYSIDGKNIDIQVDRGTWMSLDVSPDGKSIAFDLLGDIYLLPIEGGKAKNIASGFQWDMQPRFSPDGKKIAFTSDRSGGDNIWVMDADGSNSQPVTKEKFRLLNNPTWSLDGRFIAARKHFTTARSLGTGEIWVYDLRGGSGVALIERPNKSYQKELGEPIYAPDGEGLYFTQNATPGDTFIYAQDTNGEVFRIKRVTLETGEVEDVAGGPGGAVRPTPSPDGVYLAYVKRVRAQSRLFVKNLHSGVEEMLVDTLDQDMQESWAVHGVYPNMDWTPDSRSIVFWSGGQIQRVDVQSRQVTPIPFRVSDTRRVYPAPRLPVDVGAERFTTKMARFAVKHADSNRVVFETLGKLYVVTSDDTPKRLTSDNGDHFELFPTLSRDGRWIYFVSWTDTTLGEVRRVRAGGGRSQVVSPTPDHYRELDVSPNGETLIVRIGRGGRLLDDTNATPPGIYELSKSGLRLITKNGSQAHFGKTSDRIFIRRSHRKGAENWNQLVSIDLNGLDERTVAESHLATQVRVSPDEGHIAFVENYQAHVAPFIKTGNMLTLAPKADAVPIRQASHIGAEFLHWSSPENLHWSIGPQFKTANLNDLYSEDYEAESTAQLSLEVTAAKPSGRIALINARIVTMGPAGVIDGGTLLIEDNRIVAVGEVDLPAGTPTVDLELKTVIPGMIDIHAHGPYGQDYIVPQQNWSALGHLAFGVTTVHDPSNRAAHVFAAAEYARAGKILSPRTYSTGEVVYGAKASVYAQINSLEDALAHVRRLKAQGAISVKNYNQPRRDQRQQVVEAARQEGLMVVAEGGALYHMDLNLVADGNTGIEHTLPQLAIYDDVVQFWGQTNVGYTPTLVVGYGTIPGEDYFYQQSDVWKHPILSRFVPPKILQPRAVRRQMAPQEDYLFAKNAKIGKQLADAGVLVNTGAHGQREGLATHWELWMFVDGGMSPLEALRAATIAPARYLGFDKELGSIEPGKLADLVVIDGDVTQDIQVSDQVVNVMLNGRLYDVPSLNEVETGDHQTRSFYWSDRPESKIQ